MNMWTRLICFCLVSSAFGQAPVLTSTKLRNVDPPTVRLTWNAVSTPTPNYDLYEIASFVIDGCPATTAKGWVKIGDGLKDTTFDRQIPLLSYGTPVVRCWYVQGYVNGVPTAPSNESLTWIATGGYVFFNYILPDPISGGCPVNASAKGLFPYPYSSGGSVTIVQSLNGSDAALTTIAGPVFYKNQLGQITGESFAFHVNVIDGATYTAIATFPDGYIYSFPIFTDWAGTPASQDFYDYWSLNKLYGSGQVCRRSVYQDEQPTD